MRQTHTAASMVVSAATYAEIGTLLAQAGYNHAFVNNEDGTAWINMYGIALVKGSNATDNDAVLGAAEEAHNYAWQKAIEYAADHVGDATIAIAIREGSGEHMVKSWSEFTPSESVIETLHRKEESYGDQG